MQPTTGRAHHEIFSVSKIQSGSLSAIWRIFFLLSCLWYLCCLPVVTAGAATTALYYVTLKMARGQEGQLIPAFFHSFKQNLKQATALWVGYLAVGILLVLDLVICLQTSSVFAGAMFFYQRSAAGLLGAVYHHAVPAGCPVR